MTPPVRVSYLGVIQTRLGMGGEILDVGTGVSLADILAALKERHGPVFSRLLTADGGLRGNVRVMVDGKDIWDLDGLETMVPAEAHILVVELSPLAGGAERRDPGDEVRDGD